MNRLSLLAVMAAAVGLVLTGLVPSHATADPPRCFPLVGRFDAVPAPPSECTSPVGFCTRGDLTGTLNGSYEFTMDSTTSADPRVPAINSFTGESVVSTTRGATITGVDTGTIDLNPARFGSFVSLITFQSATGYLEGFSRGQIALRGALDFASGQTEGNFRGQLCF
jgi:hypothetical protein